MTLEAIVLLLSATMFFVPNRVFALFGFWPTIYGMMFPVALLLLSSFLVAAVLRWWRLAPPDLVVVMIAFFASLPIVCHFMCK